MILREIIKEKLATGSLKGLSNDLFTILSFPCPVRLQHLIELVWTGKLFGASFACLGLGLSTGKPFRTYWALKDAKGPELSSVVSESW